MAVPTGSGTETIHSHSFNDVDAVQQKLIIGVKHHVYTVITIIVQCNALDLTTDNFWILSKGHDVRLVFDETSS